MPSVPNWASENPRASKSLFPGLQCFVDQFRLIEMQPASFGRIQLNAILGATCRLVQRKASLSSSEIPQGGVDCRQGEGADWTHRQGMDAIEKIAPDFLNLVGLTPDQQGSQMVIEQLDDRRPAGPDRIGIAGADSAIRITDSHHRSFLTLEALDSVRTPDLWL